MIRKLPILSLPIFLFVFVSSVYAQNTTGSAITSNSGSKAALLQQRSTAVAKAKDDVKTAIQTARQEFKTSLLTIKDQKKRTLMDKIDSRITAVNTDQTTKFFQTLDRLQTFIDKMNKQATGTAVLSDVTPAQTAIDNARAAVALQAAKTYTIVIADDSTLRINAGKVVSQFRLDLVAVYKLVIDAKQAVQKLNPDRVIIKKDATSSAK